MGQEKVKKPRAKKSFTAMVNELDDSITKSNNEFAVAQAKINLLSSALDENRAMSALKSSQRAIEILTRYMIHLTKNGQVKRAVEVQEEIDQINAGKFDIAVVYALIASEPEPEIKEVDFEETEANRG